MPAQSKIAKVADILGAGTPAGRRNAIFSTFVFVVGSAALWYKARSLKREKNKRKLVTTTTYQQPKRVAVNNVFGRRLWHILKICLPSIRSSEFLHLASLTALLFARTWLSIKVADITGKNAQHLVERKWKSMVRGMISFLLLGIPAAAVNSGLKYETSMLSLRFRMRLSKHVNAKYLEGVNFYKASHLGKNKIDNADQRVTSDIMKFCEALSGLYTTIFKPVVDVILFTQKLAAVLGWRGPLMIFLYYLFSGFVKKVMMPKFGQHAVRESELEGDYRTAHNRLITNAEEIAFYDGGRKERTIIDALFGELHSHLAYVHYLKFLVGIFDTFLVKYGASLIGYAVMCLPVFFGDRGQGKGAAELTRDYVRNRQLLINLATAIGQLLILTNKVTSLAGLTARVAELLEMVKELNTVGNRPFQLRNDEPTGARAGYSDGERSSGAPSAAASAAAAEVEIRWLAEWTKRGQQLRERRLASAGVRRERRIGGEGGQIVPGDNICFEKVKIVSPEGKVLVENLSFAVNPHQNVMVTGPNGSGKSSLFRILGELWPLHNGMLTKPDKEDILFVPQKPYLVLGTLRDQIIYPHSRQQMEANGVADADLEKLMDIVDPTRIILNQWAWDEVKDWVNTFSGGQKQRVAMARLFYHRPLYAILDECTSAVSDEVEDKMYQTCAKLGITLFTVSHRKYLRRFHDYVLRFEGNIVGDWSFRKIRKNAEGEPLEDADSDTEEVAA